ncbi:MAG TPA: hypothetical protein VLG46_12095 [Anaerolineae bacterium]|nr:hypothetical protein [Anaerolineae bacterium]
MSVTHRYTPIWWLLFLGVGALCEVIVFGTLAKNLTHAIAGNMNLVEYAGLLFVVVCMLPSGIVVLLGLFTTKIVVSPQGMEYHTFAAILRASWQDIVNLGNMGYGYMGTGIIFIAQNPEIRVRTWAKYLPWNVADGIARQGIPVFHFGGFRGQRLQSDLRRFAPHLIA